jgi:competence protein ComEA
MSDLLAALPPRRVLLAVVVAVVVLALASRLLLGHGRAAPAGPAPIAVAPVPAAPPRLVVDVVGAVRRAGLYRLSKGARIADAVAVAGGATRHADLAQLNLAAPLADGEQVVVPVRGRAGAAAGAAPAGAGGTAPVQLSTATLEQLDGLPGIGPVTAQKILDYRQQHGAFSSVEELDAISGIGPARLDQLKGLVVP